jgi:hypothetical protein
VSLTNPYSSCFSLPTTNPGEPLSRKQEADTPITTIHGACVSQSRVSFYRYDRKVDLFTPESRLFQEKFFDFDIMEHEGAVRYLQVVEDVKNACREVLGELQTVEAYRWEHSNWAERLMTIVFGESWR